MCLDALVEEGDQDFDWRLSFEEFKRLLSDTFVPSAKGKFQHHVDNSRNSIDRNG